MRRGDEGQKCELQRQLSSKRSFISSTYCSLLAFWGSIYEETVVMFSHGKSSLGRESVLSIWVAWLGVEDIQQ